jgi:hypothetical protein
VQAIDIAGVAGGRVSKRLDCTLGMIAREECLVKSKYEWESFGAADFVFFFGFEDEDSRQFQEARKRERSWVRITACGLGAQQCCAPT